jgi:hypothetical protein
MADSDNVCHRLPPKEIYDVLHAAEEKGIELPKSVELWWELETDMGQGLTKEQAEVQAQHPDYTVVYLAICGWQSALMTWTLAEGPGGGFYEPFTTGLGPYGHNDKGRQRAVAEAKQWAEDEGIQYKGP